MTNREMDHTPLDPRVDPHLWQTMVSSIVESAQPHLDRLAATRPVAPLATLANYWLRPVAAVAAIVLIASASALFATAGTDTSETWGVAEAIAPEPVAAWLIAGVVPTAEEVVFALEEVER